MQRRLILEFTKMNGAGNDFIVIDNRFYNFSDEELSDLAKRFCPRRTGVGADGILAFSTPQDPEHHYRMRYFNADGSRGSMCGNGARCLARFARLAGVDAEEMVFESDAGLYRALVPAAATAPVRLYVPPPRDFRPETPLHAPAARAAGAAHYIWPGVEHIVLFVDAVENAPVETLGPEIRWDEALAPAGANVNFVEVLDADRAGEARLRVRTFEKGVEGETLACGTGAMASALVARLLEQVQQSTVAVEMPGGTLNVGFQRDGETIYDLYLEGPADVVYRGTLEV